MGVNVASHVGTCSTPFVPQGRATPALDIPDEGPRALATQSLANATGCDGGTLRVHPVNWMLHAHRCALSVPTPHPETG